MIGNPQRGWEILDAIVRLHIETGRPVSSGLVERFLQRTYSSATIRNVMKGLEDDGYLEQPHTSAGRRPTDRGFRAFVDRILAAWPLSRWEAPRPLAREVEAGFSRHAGSHAMVKVLAELLSHLSDSVGIILGPAWDHLRAVRLELHQKGNRRILMVLVLENALVRTSVITASQDYGDATVAAAAQVMSERISGRTVAEIRDGVLPTIQTDDGPVSRCARDLAGLSRDLFLEMEAGDLELEGVANVLDEPEFAAPGTLKNLIRFIESPRTIRDVLRRLDRESDGALGVWIGGENPVDDLREFTVVLQRFPLAGREGILAVLGPRRMAYHRALTGIDLLRANLGARS
jgi:heat-inducible transcriptional repressor